MTAIFPTNPTLNQKFPATEPKWEWNGDKWTVIPINDKFLSSVTNIEKDVTYSFNDSTSFTSELEGLATTTELNTESERIDNIIISELAIWQDDRTYAENILIRGSDLNIYKAQIAVPVNQDPINDPDNGEDPIVKYWIKETNFDQIETNKNNIIKEINIDTNTNIITLKKNDDTEFTINLSHLDIVDNSIKSARLSNNNNNIFLTKQDNSIITIDITNLNSTIKVYNNTSAYNNNEFVSFQSATETFEIYKSNAALPANLGNPSPTLVYYPVTASTVNTSLGAVHISNTPNREIDMTLSSNLELTSGSTINFLSKNHTIYVGTVITNVFSELVLQFNQTDFNNILATPGRFTNSNNFPAWNADAGFFVSTSSGELAWTKVTNHKINDDKVGITTAQATQIETNKTNIDLKQNILTAGDNITITGNTISATEHTDFVKLISNFDNNSTYVTNQKVINTDNKIYKAESNVPTGQGNPDTDPQNPNIDFGINNAITGIALALSGETSAGGLEVPTPSNYSIGQTLTLVSTLVNMSWTVTVISTANLQVAFDLSQADKDSIIANVPNSFAFGTETAWSTDAGFGFQGTPFSYWTEISDLTQIELNKTQIETNLTNITSLNNLTVQTYSTTKSYIDNQIAISGINNDHYKSNSAIPANKGDPSTDPKFDTELTPTNQTEAIGGTDFTFAILLDNSESEQPKMEVHLSTAELATVNSGTLRFTNGSLSFTGIFNIKSENRVVINITKTNRDAAIQIAGVTNVDNNDIVYIWDASAGWEVEHINGSSYWAKIEDTQLIINTTELGRIDATSLNNTLTITKPDNTTEIFTPTPQSPTWWEIILQGKTETFTEFNIDGGLLKAIKEKTYKGTTYFRVVNQTSNSTKSDGWYTLTTTTSVGTAVSTAQREF